MVDDATIVGGAKNIPGRARPLALYLGIGDMMLTMLRESSSGRIWGNKSGDANRLKKGPGFIFGGETLLKMQNGIRNLVYLANFVQTCGVLEKNC
jgi:hypothetical protein